MDKTYNKIWLKDSNKQEHNFEDGCCTILASNNLKNRRENLNVNWVLIDNQSIIHNFCSSFMLSNIQKIKSSKE